MRRLTGATVVLVLALSGAALGEGLDDFSAPPPEVTAPKPQAQPSLPAATSALAPTPAPSAPEPGSVFRDCPACPEMVVIPAGSFLMGSPASEDGDDDEGPQRRVTIGSAFALGRFEVTRRQYAAFVEATARSSSGGCSVWTGSEMQEQAGRSWRDPGYSQTDNDPVVCVSWEDARAYAQWLSQKTGKAYRLATEAEWEYAARAGTQTRYYWGSSESGICGRANLADASATFDWKVDCNDGFTRTAPVGSYLANGFGLYDMLGNVWEWVLDCYASYAGASASGAAQLASGCDLRVARGGYWSSEPRNVRAANRGWDEPGVRGNDSGFRVARTY